MKRIIFLLAGALALASFIACSNGNSTAPATEESQDLSEPTGNAQVEVMYFHGKKRCATCVAIENETKAAMENELAAEVAEGKVCMRTIDISTDEGKAIAQRYKIAFSSLIIVANPGESEQVDDITSFAFSNARLNAAEFRQELHKRVTANL